MMRACPADFARLAGYLGFSCDDESWVKLRNPLTLAHWTMPVVELLMLVGAALALAPAPRPAALQRAVPAVPALLTHAGAVGALAVPGAGLAAGPAGAARPGPARPADTPPALALPARPAVQPAHLQYSHFI